MDRIKSLVSIARNRLRQALVVDALATGLVAAAVLLGLLVVLSKLVPGFDASSTVLFAGASAGGVLAAIISFAVNRSRTASTDAALALAIDARLKLDERMTTALAFEQSTDSYARAAIADAVEVASRADTASKVRAAFPVPVPHRATYGALGVAALVAAQIYIPAYSWPMPEPTGAELASLE